MEKLGCNTQNIISTTTTILSSSPKDGIKPSYGGAIATRDRLESSEPVKSSLGIKEATRGPYWLRQDKQKLSIGIVCFLSIASVETKETLSIFQTRSQICRNYGTSSEATCHKFGRERNQEELDGKGSSWSKANWNLTVQRLGTNLDYLHARKDIVTPAQSNLVVEVSKAVFSLKNFEFGYCSTFVVIW